MLRICLQMLIIFLFCTPATAAPFGVHMGDTLKAFPKAKKISEKIYAVNTLPKPHPLFDKYILYIDDIFGLYQVEGISNKMEGVHARYYTLDGNGSIFINIENMLNEKYGKGTSEDYAPFNIEKSVWKKGNEGIKLNDNIILIILQRIDNKKEFKDLEEIIEYGDSINETYRISLKYTFINCSDVEKNTFKKSMESL